MGKWHIALIQNPSLIICNSMKWVSKSVMYKKINVSDRNSSRTLRLKQLSICKDSLASRTPDTQWRHKSKISEKLGRCGRQNMLWPYLKTWEWEWIFGRAVKAISSLGVRSPWVPRFSNRHCKVQVFWKGYKNLKKTDHRFWRYWLTVKTNCFKSCGLLTISLL